MSRKKPFARKIRKEGFFSQLIVRRILAFFLDLLIINIVVAGPFRAVIEYAFPAGQGISSSIIQSNETLLAIIYPVLFFIGIFAFFYFVLMEYMAGQTIGKIFLNIEVVSETNKISLGQSMMRSLFVIPFFPLTLLWIIDPLYLLIWSDKNQRLSEYLSKTYVTIKSDK